MTDKNCLSYWFPRLQAAGVPVPETHLVHWQGERRGLLHLLDGKTPDGWQAFIDRLKAAGERVGYPLFLRTGQGSGKHQWRDTCFVPDAESIPQHVAALVEWSECVDMLGLPTEVWAVRKFLPLRQSFTAFHGMPVAREFRSFLRPPMIRCRHPYWPRDSIKKPSIAGWELQLEELNRLKAGETAALDGLCLSVAADQVLAADEWSLDIAQDEQGKWWAIDMALAARSFHWPGCPMNTGGESA